jgi:hypothetical protein
MKSKNNLFGAFLILGLLMITASQTKAQNCCDSSAVVHRINENCCVEVTISQQCQNALVVFERYDSGSSSYIVENALTLQSGVYNYELCPQEGETSISYRIRFIDPSDGVSPLCLSSFTEERNQFTFSYDVSDCCECPTGADNWLTAYTVKDLSCPDGCKVMFDLNIPDSIDCFTHFKVIDPTNGDISPIQELGVLKGFSYCVGEGQNTGTTVALFKDGDTTTSCLVYDSLFCSTPNPFDTLKPPCTTTCPQDDWETSIIETYELESCPGCQVEVSYTYRKACGFETDGGFQELQIQRMRLKSSECMSYPCSPEDIYIELLGNIITENVMDFDPQTANDSCRYNWRVSLGSCMGKWREYLVYGPAGPTDTNEIWEPCWNSECCVDAFKVCRIKPDSVVIEHLDSLFHNPHPIHCDSTFTIKPNGDTVGCVRACDWNANLEGIHGYSEKRVMLEEFRLNEDTQIYRIREDIQNGNLSIFINSNINSKAEIILYDLRGNVLLNKKIDIMQNLMNTINIDISNYISGPYYYNIVIDGSYLHTGKVLHIK